MNEFVIHTSTAMSAGKGLVWESVTKNCNISSLGGILGTKPSSTDRSMKILRHAVGCITIASLGVVTLGLTAQTVNPPASSTPVTDAAGERALLNQYCATCHNQKLKTADLELDQLDTAHVADHAEKWELVVRKLRSGMMPPSRITRPEWT